MKISPISHDPVVISRVFEENKKLKRASYIMALAILQSDLWKEADEELVSAVKFGSRFI